MGEVFALEERDGPAVDLSALFLEHHRALYRAALKILGSRERAEDAVQDAYLKVICSACVMKLKQPLAYLFRVVRNLAIDRHRRVAMEQRLFANEEEGVDVPMPMNTPDVIAMGRQDLRRIAQAMAALPARTQHVFELYRLNGQTQQNIATQLGVSTTLVNFMIQDALVCCRAVM